jgi:hypothetical protein
MSPLLRSGGESRLPLPTIPSPRDPAPFCPRPRQTPRPASAPAVTVRLVLPPAIIGRSFYALEGATYRCLLSWLLTFSTVGAPPPPPRRTSRPTAAPPPQYSSPSYLGRAAASALSRILRNNNMSNETMSRVNAAGLAHLALRHSPSPPHCWTL